MMLGGGHALLRVLGWVQGYSAVPLVKILRLLRKIRMEKIKNITYNYIQNEPHDSGSIF